MTLQFIFVCRVKMVGFAYMSSWIYCLNKVNNSILLFKKCTYVQVSVGLATYCGIITRGILSLLLKYRKKELSEWKKVVTTIRV